jgi:hypothetical protein
LAAALVVAAGWTSPAAAIHTTGSADHVRPDLQTLTPANFSVQSSKKGRGKPGRGSAQLLFDNEVMNLHTGPLEVRPTDQQCTTGQGASGRVAVQRVYFDSNGDGGRLGSDSGYYERTTGCMTFHAQHHHWHFDDFSYFELRDGADTVAAGSKMTFCIADVNRRQELFTSGNGLGTFSPTATQYNLCSRSAPQGLSVGWGDLYSNGTSGQYVDITHVDDGDYCFVSIADPLDTLVETDEENNAARSLIRLSTAGSSRQVSLLTIGSC